MWTRDNVVSSWEEMGTEPRTEGPPQRTREWTAICPPAPPSQTCGLQDCDALNPLVCDTLLEPPWRTRPRSITEPLWGGAISGVCSPAQAAGVPKSASCGCTPGRGCSIQTSVGVMNTCDRKLSGRAGPERRWTFVFPGSLAGLSATRRQVFGGPWSLGGASPLPVAAMASLLPSRGARWHAEREIPGSPRNIARLTAPTAIRPPRSLSLDR